jgi:thioredoxin 1
MPTIKISDESFEKDVLKNDKAVCVDFFADWCQPCTQIAPALEEISDEMKDQVVIAKHNIDDNPNQPTKFGVRGIPTMLLFKDGELKATKVGATTKSNIISWIKENI